jgi:hypothetical protein
MQIRERRNLQHIVPGQLGRHGSNASTGKIRGRMAGEAGWAGEDARRAGL